MLKGQNIICISHMGWRFLWTSEQYFMDMLADEGNRVLYVEPFLSPLSCFRYPETRIEGRFRSYVQEVKEDLHVLSPSFLYLPLSSRIRLFQKINYWLWGRSIKAWQERLGLFAPLVWTNVPQSVSFVEDLNPRLLIYDCIDEQTAYPGVDREYVLRTEEELLRKADLVFVTAQGLLERKSKLNPNTFFIPNGVDFQFFARVQTEDLAVPEDIRHLPRPLIGFVGGIYDWIDLDLIKTVAQARPQWTIIMIGPVGTDIELAPFKEVQNVFFLGHRPKEVIPNYLKAFDVCLNPRKQNELTRYMNPLKIYEYLAAGKPVVSIDMPEVRRLGPVVSLAGSPSDFVARIEEMLAANGAADVEARMQVAKAYDWASLLAQSCQRIEERLAALSK